MRKFLAVLLMGGALMVSVSAAFAQDTMGSGQLVANNLTGPFVVDDQTTPFAPNPQSR